MQTHLLYLFNSAMQASSTDGYYVHVALSTCVYWIGVSYKCDHAEEKGSTQSHAIV